MTDVASPCRRVPSSRSVVTMINTARHKMGISPFQFPFCCIGGWWKVGKMAPNARCLQPLSEALQKEIKQKKNKQSIYDLSESASSSSLGKLVPQLTSLSLQIPFGSFLLVIENLPTVETQQFPPRQAIHLPLLLQLERFLLLRAPQSHRQLLALIHPFFLPAPRGSGFE